jgi:biotin carboxylase
MVSQVEHPVTEWIAEVNLPAAQVAVGMGIPLWQIPGNASSFSSCSLLIE